MTAPYQLMIALVLLQLVDWSTSTLARRLPGAYEANKLMAAQIARYGFHKAFALKAVVVAALAFLLTQMKLPGLIALVVTNVFYTGVCLWNLWLTLRRPLQ